MSSFTTDSKHLKVLQKYTSVPPQQPTHSFYGNFASAVAATTSNDVMRDENLPLAPPLICWQTTPSAHSDGLFHLAQVRNPAKLCTLVEVGS